MDLRERKALPDKVLKVQQDKTVLKAKTGIRDHRAIQELLVLRVQEAELLVLKGTQEHRVQRVTREFREPKVTRVRREPKVTREQ